MELLFDNKINHCSKLPQKIRPTSSVTIPPIGLIARIYFNMGPADNLFGAPSI